MKKTHTIVPTSSYLSTRLIQSNKDHVGFVEQGVLMSPNPSEKVEDFAAGCGCCLVV